MKSKKTQKKSVRLSTDIVPIEYDLRIHPDLHNFTFEGIETISLSLKKPVTKITLHSKELEIETAEILVGRQKVFASKIIYDEKSETATFVFKQKIPVGKTKLALVFKGILNDKMRGFYKSTYVVDGKENHMATIKLRRQTHAGHFHVLMNLRTRRFFTSHSLFQKVNQQSQIHFQCQLWNIVLVLKSFDSNPKDVDISPCVYCRGF